MIQLYQYDEEFNEFMTWLFEDYDNLKMYIMGGSPDGGNYVNSLLIFNELYHTYKDDLFDHTLSSTNIKNSEVYQKMMTSISLGYATTVRFWTAKSGEEVGELTSYDHPSVSNPIDRYLVYKVLRNEGLLGYSGTDGTFVFSNQMFDSLEVEEMRYVLNTAMNDEMITWLNWYAQSDLAITNHGEGRERNPYRYLKYNSGFNFYLDQFHDMSLFDSWDEKYDFSRFGIDTLYYEAPLPWVVFEAGAICWGISKLGDNLWSSFGVPSNAISQPNHLAYIFSSYDADNDQLYWGGIWNNITNWGTSGPGGTTAFSDKFKTRMPLTWGSDSSVSGYCASYLFLSQENINHFETYTNSQMIILLENTYQNDNQILEEIYKEAIHVNSIDYDAWLALTKLYASDVSKTNEELLLHLENISIALKYQPLPMYDLFRLIEPRFSDSGEYSMHYHMLLAKNLNDCIGVTQDETLEYIGVKQVATHLSGSVDTDIASFSFDGEDANTIVLSESKFGGSNTVWDYSLDGGVHWTQVEDMKQLLSEEELQIITSEFGIQVHIVGASYSSDNIFSISINETSLPTNLYANDLENKLFGTTSSLEYYDETLNTWKLLSEGYPEDMDQDISLTIRVKGIGLNKPSDSETHIFTKDSDIEARTYVSIDRLSVYDYSSHTSKELPSYAIDGNINTGFHTTADGQRYITIQLDEAIMLSAIEYTPRLQGSNGQVIDAQVYVSMNGIDFTLAGSASGWAQDFTTKSLDLEEPVEALYIKFHAQQGRSNFLAISMLNIFEDISEGVDTSILIESIESVENTLVDTTFNKTQVAKDTLTSVLNEAIVLLNNTDATQDQIDAMITKLVKAELDYKQSSDVEIPVGSVTYSTTSPTNQDVIATLHIADGVKIINNNGSNEYIFTDNDSFTFIFEKDGVEGNAIATVSNIDKVAPTASIVYSEIVGMNAILATLTNTSEDIIITNNNGSSKYVFMENGTFTFEYKDLAGNNATTIATVNSLVKDTQELIFHYTGSLEYTILKGVPFTLPDIKASVDSNYIPVDTKVLLNDKEVEFSSKVAGNYSIQYIANNEGIEETLTIHVLVIDIPDSFIYVSGNGNEDSPYTMYSEVDNASEDIQSLFSNLLKAQYTILVTNREVLEDGYIEYTIQSIHEVSSSQKIKMRVKENDTVEQIIYPYYVSVPNPPLEDKNELIPQVDKNENTFTSTSKPSIDKEVIVEVADKDLTEYIKELDLLILNFMELNEKDYTSKSYLVLKEYIELAKQLLVNESNITLDSLTEMIEDVNASWNALQFEKASEDIMEPIEINDKSNSYLIIIFFIAITLLTLFGFKVISIIINK